MAAVAIVFHSGFGHTKRVADAIKLGAERIGAQVALIEINAEGELDDSQWQTLDGAKAIVMGSPTYMGMVSWQFKRFADASSKRWFNQVWKNKWAGGFTNSGSINGDKHSSLSYLFTLAMQHGMVWAGTALLPSNRSTSSRDDINYLGAFSGLMTQSPTDLGPDVAPGSGDLATASAYGERLAQLALNR